MRNQEHFMVPSADGTAIAVWVEALNRPPWKVHLSKVALELVLSEKSTSEKVHSTKRVAPSS